MELVNGDDIGVCLAYSCPVQYISGYGVVTHPVARKEVTGARALLCERHSDLNAILTFIEIKV